VAKAGIATMTAVLAQLLADRGIRASSVASGPVWTPLIPLDHAGEAHSGIRLLVVAGPSGPARRGHPVTITGGKPIL
jgi:hypothetical protein